MDFALERWRVAPCHSGGEAADNTKDSRVEGLTLGQLPQSIHEWRTVTILLSFVNAAVSIVTIIHVEGMTFHAWGQNLPRFLFPVVYYRHIGIVK